MISHGRFRFIRLFEILWANVKNSTLRTGSDVGYLKQLDVMFDFVHILNEMAVINKNRPVYSIRGLLDLYGLYQFYHQYALSFLLPIHKKRPLGIRAGSDTAECLGFVAKKSDSGSLFALRIPYGMHGDIADIPPNAQMPTMKYVGPYEYFELVSFSKWISLYFLQAQHHICRPVRHLSPPTVFQLVPTFRTYQNRVPALYGRP